ncbi:MAG: Polysaccharide biosynthesis protein [Microgenomates bacterium 39_7]|nr:MAG: Polysaccharide biosynthesis protein [Microgenomates bacterium 39_7]
MGYTKKVISGFSWDTLLKISTYFLTVIKIYVLARILSPSDFGVFSLVVIALGLSEAMTQTGINLTIIQSKHSVEYFLNTAWVIAIGRGFLIGVLMIILGYLMSLFYSQPSLTIMVALAALVPTIKGFINPYVVTLHKNMLYSRDVLYRFFVQATLILGTLLLGLWLRNVYALILGMVFAALIETLLSFAIFKIRPKFEFVPSRARIIFDNARWLSIGSFLHYLVENIDDFLIGAITNTHSLGLYHNAYSLTHKGSYDISKSVHYGTIPVYSKLVAEKSRLKIAFRKTLFSTTIITLLIAIPIYFFNSEIVLFLMGETWTESIPLIRPLIMAGVIQGFFMVCYTMMLAQKKYKMMNYHLMGTLILMTSLIIICGRQTGLLGAVNGILYSRIVLLLPMIWYVYNFFKVNSSENNRVRS